MLLAILESRHGENTERILYSLSPKQLVRIISRLCCMTLKKTLVSGINEAIHDWWIFLRIFFLSWRPYPNPKFTQQLFVFQVETCRKVYNLEGFNGNNNCQSDISPREVGHNIYILAHQVNNKLPKISNMMQS